MPRISLRPLAMLVLTAALALVALGGVVHTTGSSLACPDWPLCNGDVMPRMEGGVLYEHSHRLLALAVSIGVLALAWVATGRMRKLAMIALVVIVVQALLGAMTVLLRLPPLVSILHLAGATAMIALLATIASGERSGPRSAHVDLVLAVVAAQVVLGAAVRHLGASAACGRDILVCNGELVPIHSLGWLHYAHRALGFVAAALVVRVALAARSHRSHASRVVALALVIAAPLQIALGLLSVVLGPRLVPVTSHLLLGELLVAGLAHLAVCASITPRSLAPLRRPLAAPSP